MARRQDEAVGGRVSRPGVFACGPLWGPSGAGNRAARARALRDERNAINEGKHVRYNILWSNVETLKPVLYGRTPEPDVSRRHKDETDAPAAMGADIATVSAERDTSSAGRGEGRQRGCFRIGVRDSLRPVTPRVRRSLAPQRRS
jgi:hypothetical protein